MPGTTSPQAVDYLLIGGGLASASAAKEHCRRDVRGSILLVADELARPYHCPSLSKESLRGAISVERVYDKGSVYVHQRPGHDEQRDVMLHGVTALDTVTQRVHLAGGRAVQCHQLVLAAGRRPRGLNVPGAYLPGVYLLCTAADANDLQKQLSDSSVPRVHGKRAVVIGCGFVGLETSAGAMVHGALVIMTNSRNCFWSRVISPNVSTYFEGLYAHRGAQVCPQRIVTGFMARPDDGSPPCGSLRRECGGRHRRGCGRVSG